MGTQTERKNELGFYDINTLFPQTEKVGSAEINKVSISESRATIDNIRMWRTATRKEYDVLKIEAGDYVTLIVNNQIMMSNTPMEQKSNRMFVKKAHGHVLVAGLGLGLILVPTLKKRSVKTITVIEKNPDVIELTLPKIRHPKLKVICSDIHGHVFETETAVQPVFDTIYFDIWPEISTDNLMEIKKLERQYKKYLNPNNPSAYMDSWMKEMLKSRRFRGL